MTEAKAIINFLFDYFKNTKKNTIRTIVLFSALINTLLALLTIVISYGLTGISSLGLTWETYIDLNGGFLSLLFYFSKSVLPVTLVTIALLTPYFEELSKPNGKPKLFEIISSKKWGMYFSFIILFSFLSYLFPSIDRSLLIFDEYIHHTMFWVLEFVHIVLTLLAFLFTYILIHKERFSFDKNETKRILTIIVLSLIIYTLASSISNYINIFVISLIAHVFNVTLALFITCFIGLLIISFGIVTIVTITSYKKVHKPSVKLDEIDIELSDL